LRNGSKLKAPTSTKLRQLLLKALLRAPILSAAGQSGPGSLFGTWRPIAIQIGEDAMDMKLSDDEISILQSLDVERSPAVEGRRDGDLPKKLFEFNLVSRQSGGQAAITKNGQRALFRHACVLALAAMARGDEIALGNGVEKWLVASGFAKSSDEAGPMAILPRGRLWLNSLEPDAEVKATCHTAESFAARRS
jgi:hypothetical protein